MTNLLERCATVCREHILSFLSVRECGVLLQVSHQCHVDARASLLHSWVHGPPVVQAYGTASGKFWPYVMTLCRANKARAQSTDATSTYIVLRNSVVGKHTRKFSLADAEIGKTMKIDARLQHHPAWCGMFDSTKMRNPYASPHVIGESNMRMTRKRVYTTLQDDKQPYKHYTQTRQAIQMRWKASLGAAKEPLASSLDMRLVSTEIERVHLRATWPRDACVRTMLLAQDVSGGRHVCGSTSASVEPCFTVQACHFVRLMLEVALVGVSRTTAMNALHPIVVHMLDARKEVLGVWSDADVRPFAEAFAETMVAYGVSAAGTRDPLPLFDKWALSILRSRNASSREILVADIRAPYVRAARIRQALVQADLAPAAINTLLSLEAVKRFCGSGTNSFHIDIAYILAGVSSDNDEEDEEEDDDKEEESDEDSSDGGGKEAAGEEDEDDDDEDEDEEDENNDGVNQRERKVRKAMTRKPKVTPPTPEQLEARRIEHIVEELIVLYRAGSDWDLQALAYMAAHEHWSNCQHADVQVARAIQALRLRRV
jgi:hypothetical protein